MWILRKEGLIRSVILMQKPFHHQCCLLHLLKLRRCIANRLPILDPRKRTVGKQMHCTCTIEYSEFFHRATRNRLADHTIFNKIIPHHLHHKALLLLMPRHARDGNTTVGRFHPWHLNGEWLHLPSIKIKCEQRSSPDLIRYLDV